MICVVDRATNIVKDVDQRYDERFFDHVTVPDGTIPATDNPRKFRRVNGNIVRRNRAELIVEFLDERKADLIQQVDSILGISPELRGVLRALAENLK